MQDDPMILPPGYKDGAQYDRVQARKAHGKRSWRTMGLVAFMIVLLLVYFAGTADGRNGCSCTEVTSG